MKRFFRTGLVLLPLSMQAGCATFNYREPQTPFFTGGEGMGRGRAGEIRVVTFNIEYGRRIEEAIAALQLRETAGADIVALQEMDAAGVERIAGALGMNYVYYPASINPKTGRDYGNAILSPWPIRRHGKVLLPHRSFIMNQYRIAVSADVIIGDVEIRAYSLHFGSPLGTSNAARRDQARAVLRDAGTSRLPIIILGDFNGMDAARCIADSGYAWLTERVGATTRRMGIGTPADHVLAIGMEAADSIQAGVQREAPRASDHQAVWARLKLPQPAMNEGASSRAGIDLRLTRRLP